MEQQQFRLSQDRIAAADVVNGQTTAAVRHKSGFLDDDAGRSKSMRGSFLSAQVPDSGDDVPLAANLAKMAWTCTSAPRTPSRASRPQLNTLLRKRRE